MSHENGYRRTVVAFILAVFILPPIAIAIGGVVADFVDSWLDLKVLRNIFMVLFAWFVLLLLYMPLLYIYRKADAKRRNHDQAKHL